MAKTNEIARFTVSNVVACILALAITAAGLFTAILNPSPAYANSARAMWEGISATGTIVADEECPIQVQHENLVLNIQQFPQQYYETEEDYLAYNASVRAEYTFYNPADYTVATKLLFPFGRTPDYMDLSTHEDWSTAANSIDKYGVTINGEPVEYTVRHTLSYNDEIFDLSTDLPRMADTYKEDPFYALELPATKYVFEITDIPEGHTAATLAFRWTCSDDARILLLDQSGLQYLGETTAAIDDQSTPDTDAPNEVQVFLTTWAENGRTATVYVFGEAPESLSYELFEDGSCEEQLEGTVTLVETENSSFARFALHDWTEESGVLPYDWYNAMVDDLNLCAADSSMPGVILRWSSNLDLSHTLLRWFEYEMVLDPESTLVNTVTAPLYPSIDATYDPAVYGYTYLLSPAQTWASFGTLDITVKTPYYLIESAIEEGSETKDENKIGFFTLPFGSGSLTKNLAGFEESANGYKLSLDSLPDGELTFSLSSSETPRASWAFGDNDLLVKFIFVVVLFSAGIGIGVFAGKRSKKPVER